MSAGNKARTPVHLSTAAAPALRTTDQVFTLVVKIFWVRILASSLATSLLYDTKKACVKTKCVCPSVVCSQHLVEQQ